MKTPIRIAICATTLLLLPACQNVPKYKKISGHFDEWHEYQGSNFRPVVGIDSAVNLATQTVTIVLANGTGNYIVTPETKLFHDGDPITLADLPLNQTVNITFADDRVHLLTVWYGTHSNATFGRTSAKHL